MINSVTRYLWLVPLRSKTAGAVTTAVNEEVIIRTSVPTAILTHRGGEFTGEVVQHVCERLGITHLKTDAKCERVHYSVHNMITKLIGSHPDWLPDLFGAVALAYNSTVHTSTGFAPHELFNSFPPSCALDAMIDAAREEPVGNADQYALQVTEQMRESFCFMREYSGKHTKRMRTNYDAAIKRKTFAEGSYVLLFSRKKKRGLFTRWQATWISPYRVMKKLNDTNYVLQKSQRSKGFITHGDRLKLYHGTVDSKLWLSGTDNKDNGSVSQGA